VPNDSASVVITLTARQAGFLLLAVGMRKRTLFPVPTEEQGKFLADMEVKLKEQLAKVDKAN
jgi:hypothetical protein